jgi:hypothetical protein
MEIIAAAFQRIAENRIFILNCDGGFREERVESVESEGSESESGVNGVEDEAGAGAPRKAASMALFHDSPQSTPSDR